MDIKEKIKKIKINRNPIYYFLDYYLSNSTIRNTDGNDNYFYQGKILFIYYPNKNILWYSLSILRIFYSYFIKENNIYVDDIFIDEEFRNIVTYYFNNKYKKEVELFF